MKEKAFKPLLAPNQEVNLDEIIYPILASYKLDGVRIVFYKGQILTRSLKQLPNKQLRFKFEAIRKYTEDNQCILDGEIYSHELTFQEIISFCMTQDFEDKKSVKKFGKVMTIPESLKFYCFDMIIDDDINLSFKTRINNIKFAHITLELLNIEQWSCFSKEDVENLFENALDNGYEGLILRDPNGRYKFGRGTIKEGIIYKVKPFRTFDTEVIGVVQATEVNEDAEKKTNELGRSVTSKKKGDRHLIEKASAFVVNYEDKELKVTLAMTDEEKEEVWRNKETYIGKWIEYKGMLVGSKDVPRHPVMIRFREDKNA